MTSLWLDQARSVPSDPLPEDRVDDLVVGAGITGLVTALLLARAGRRVAVVEAREVGAVATGNTTAKVSLLQGTKYTRLLHYQSRKVAAAYLDANREGMEWLLRFCDDHGVPVQRRPAVTYAADESELSSVRDEHDAAASLGLDGGLAGHARRALSAPGWDGARRPGAVRPDGRARRAGGPAAGARRHPPPGPSGPHACR